MRDRGRLGHFRARRDRGVQVQMRGPYVVPVEDDQEDHEDRAKDNKDTKHPGCSHGDWCKLGGHHGNRVKVQEFLPSIAKERRQLQRSQW